MHALLSLLLVLLTARTALLLMAAWPFTTDDAYITLRYARHFATGYGPVWNIGEQPPVEGYSNFLFVLLGGAALHAGLEPVLVFKITNVIALVVTSVLLFRLARQWLAPLPALLPLLLLTAYQGTIWWTVSGLETATYQMLVLAAVAAFMLALGYRADGARTRDSLAAAAAAGSLVFVASLTRPEGPLVMLALLIALPLAHTHTAWPRRRSLAVVLLVTFALPYALYLLWRVHTYGSLLPNPVLCKFHYHDDPWQLLREFGLLAWPLLFLAAPLLRKWRDPRHLTVLLVMGLYCAILYGVDPIVARYNRHFLPALALLLVPASVGLTMLMRAALPRFQPLVTEAALVLFIFTLTTTWAATTRVALADDAGLYGRRMATRRELAAWLNRHVEPCESVMLGDTGLIPYLVDLQVLDAYCLNCVAMPRPPINRNPQRFVDYVFEQQPTVIVVPSASPTELRPHRFYGVYPVLAEQPELTTDYVHVATFGATGDWFHYWVYARADFALPSSAVMARGVAPLEASP